MRRTISAFMAVALLAAVPANAAVLSVLKVFTHPSGLGAEVEFVWDDANPDELIVRARNTSTGVPMGFSNSDQILTGVSWDFGHPGYNGDALIIGGSVVIGPSSASLNFDNVVSQLGPGDDVSGEYGYGNMDGTGALTNFVTAMEALATPFPGPNLDATVEIDGPQAGLVANPVVVPLGGLGAIQNEFIATLALNEDLTDLNFLDDNGVLVEFGSDAAFLPEPATMAFLVLGGLIAIRRRVR